MDYKEILKGIVQIINTTEKSDIGFANICTYIGENCPELEVSEDELTWLTRFIKEEAYSLSMDIRDNEDRVKLKKLQRSLAWLEKQAGKDKLIQELGKYKVKYTQEILSQQLEKQAPKPQGKTALEAIKEEKLNNANYCSDCTNKRGCINCENGKLKETEQASKWSEEDEDNLNLAIYHIRCDDIPYFPHDVEPIVDWLKSLKQRTEE